MPITLGILAQSRQAVSTGAFDLLETQVLGSSAASVTFSSLGTYASSYEHLQLRMTLRQDTNSNVLRIRMNGDSGSNYRSHTLNGNGSSVLSSTESTTSIFTYSAAASLDVANLFSGHVLDVLDAFSTTKNTTTRNFSGHSGTYKDVNLTSGAWFNTASMTSIEILPASSNWVTGCRFSLYGIKGA
jgi:hypothetical protein